ncbi:MAG: Flp pilus assembly complex ATPase component TadA [Kofleriaceae bacterium]|nr:Flp pilus assembly complex ATPase component TadA [Kofleriaceae bacterium]MBP6838259.1 Flp pilus assembly complex ATPase component TadA [Kofleriaceae bacterium]MBP9208231.1 Flp pilus assembly complex ATPase component TadA [Kofleriaceae bacterium]
MARIDVYLRSIERFAARGAVLTSGQSVTLKFPTGDRHATQVTPHDQLVILVREIAPPHCLDQVDAGKPVKFEHESAGHRYQLAVQPRPGAWVVSIDVAAEAAPAAPVPGPPPPAPEDLAAEPSAGEMLIERTQYEPRSGAAGGSSAFDDVVAAARRAGASDVYLMSGSPPCVRIHGELVVWSDRPALDAEVLERELGAIASAEVRAQWIERGDAVFAHSSAGAGRQRVHWVRDRQGVGATVHLVAATAPTPAQLGLPDALPALLAARRGLFVLGGPRGAGTSSTLAALLHHAGEAGLGFVVTVESPIEVIVGAGRGLISQREVGSHVRSAAEGVRAAQREGADLIALACGDDREALAAGLDAVEAGVSLLVAVTAPSVPGAIERVIEAAPPQRAAHARALVAGHLVGAVTQVLCRRPSGPRVPAFELLAGGPAVAAAIRDNRSFQLGSVMSTGRGQGMSALNDSLVDLTRRRVISADEAVRRSASPTELRALLEAP